MSQQFNEAQIQLLKKIFDKWDADQDGQITTKEMSTYYKSFRKNIDLEDIEDEKETVLMDFTGVKTAASWFPEMAKIRKKMHSSDTISRNGKIKMFHSYQKE